MKQLFKDNFTVEELEEIYAGWENKGILYGWENVEAMRIQLLLDKHGYNLDSISVMNEAFETLELLI